MTSSSSSSSARGLSVHLRPRHSHHHHESFFDAFARDPFFRPLINELASTAKQVGRPAVPKEGPRPRPLHANVNVLETQQGFAIEAEMPGIRREDIRVEVCEGDRLVIRGEKRFEGHTTNNNTNNTNTNVSGELKEAKEAAEPQQRKYLTFERSYGTFERTFALPENVDASRIKASYTDGVLKVELPKAAKETPKSWTVEIN
jgi:HSP20 family protein